MECRKTKTKVVTTKITGNHYQLKVKSHALPGARESVSDKDAVGFCFASDWLRFWLKREKAWVTKKRLVFVFHLIGLESGLSAAKRKWLRRGWFYFFASDWFRVWLKRGKAQVIMTRQAFVSQLIGYEPGASFLSQSQSEVEWKQWNSRLLSTHNLKIVLRPQLKIT